MMTSFSYTYFALLSPSGTEELEVFESRVVKVVWVADSCGVASVTDRHYNTLNINLFSAPPTNRPETHNAVSLCQ